MTERILTARLNAVTDGFNKAMDAAGRKVEHLADKVDDVSAKGQRMSQAGRKATEGWSVGAGYASAQMVMTAGTFERSMRIVQATTRGTSSEMALLEGQAVKMGMTTQYTATEAADALTVLARAGLSVSESYGLLPGILQLAAAGEMDIADAARVATDVLGQFQLDVSQLAHANDILSMTANTSKADLKDLGVALSYVGPVANNVGMDLEETSAILALLADGGLRASMAGTSLRGMITHLISPSIKAQKILQQLGISVLDSAGNMRPFIDILRDFEKSGITAGQVMAIFGQRAGPGMISMIQQGSSALAGYKSQLDRAAGSAQELADAKMGGFLGAIKQIRGAVQALAIKVGNSGALDFLTQVVTVGRDAVNKLGGLPGPILAIGAGLVALSVAAGPAIWAFGKMATLYRPLVTGVQSVIASFQAMRVQMALARMEGMSTGAAMLTSFGPQAAVLVGLVALAGAFYLMRKESQEFAASHQDAATSAQDLAKSAHVATRELKSLYDATQDVIATDDDFRRANEDAINTIRNMASDAARQGYLVQIGYEMVLRGATPEEAMESVRRLAEAVGVEIPASLTVTNIDNFEGQIQAAVDQANEIMSTIGTRKGGDTQDMLTDKEQALLDNIARMASDAWQTQGPAEFAAILGSVGNTLGTTSEAYNYLTDQALKYTEVSGLSTQTSSDVVSALQEMASGASGATKAQQDLAKEILTNAEAMEGGLTPANVTLAASQLATGTSALDYAQKVATASAESDNAANAASGLSENLTMTAETYQVLEGAAEAANNKIKLSEMHLESAAKMAESFVKHIKASTSIDDSLSAGLDLGDKIADVEKGFYGEAKAADSAKDATSAASKAVDDLGNSLSRTDPKLSLGEMRLDALRAAATGFGDALENSNQLDDQITQALTLGSAYREFRRSVRRLPDDFDSVAASLGKYKPIQRDAFEDLVKLGDATTDYLSKLIESGRGYDVVRREAGRLREEYASQMRQAGLSEDAVHKYLEVLGLTPSQVETAIVLSGEAAARFKIQTYLSLLEGRIPAEVATNVTAQVESGNLEGAANTLASWAKTNPIQVDVKVNDDNGNDPLWSLPKDFDPLTAALGGYNEEQRKAIQGLQDMADGALEFIGLLVGEGKIAEAQAALGQLRDKFVEIFNQQGLNQEQIAAYLEMLGLTDGQFTTSVTLAGLDLAMFQVQTYLDLLGSEIPEEVATEVLTAIDSDDLNSAAAILEQWRQDQASKPVVIPITPKMSTAEFWSSSFGTKPLTVGVKEGDSRYGLKVPGPNYPTTVNDNQGRPWNYDRDKRTWTSQFSGRQWGGNVAANTTYRTLEQGRAELFTPDVPGKITPISKLQMRPEEGNIRTSAQEVHRNVTYDLGGVKVVSPTARRVPEAIIEGIGDAVWLKTGHGLGDSDA